MRLNTRLFALALYMWCLAALPSHAGDSPRAYPETVRWQAWSDGQTSPEISSQGGITCLIVDAPDPVGIVCAPLSKSEKVDSNLDFLLDLLTALRRAHHEPAATQPNSSVRRPHP